MTTGQWFFLVILGQILLFWGVVEGTKVVLRWRDVRRVRRWTP